MGMEMDTPCLKEFSYKEEFFKKETSTGGWVIWVFCCIFRWGDLATYLYVDEKNPVERGEVELVGKRRKT